MTTDGLIVVDMYGIGGLLISGYSGCHANVPVSLPQEDGVCKASYRLTALTVEPSLTFMHRTNSIVMTLMVYSVITGLLTR